MLHMIEEMSFKYLLDVFWPVFPRDVFRNPMKGLYGGVIFANIVNDFQLLTVKFIAAPL